MSSGICALIQASAGLSENSIVCQGGGQSNRITATVKSQEFKSRVEGNYHIITPLINRGRHKSARQKKNVLSELFAKLRNNSLLIYHSGRFNFFSLILRPPPAPLGAAPTSESLSHILREQNSPSVSGAVEEKTKRGSKCLLTLFLKGTRCQSGAPSVPHVHTHTHTKKAPFGRGFGSVCASSHRAQQPPSSPKSWRTGARCSSCQRWTLDTTHPKARASFPSAGGRSRRHSGSPGKTNARQI